MFITSPLSIICNLLTAGVLIALFTLNAHAAGLAVQQITTGLDGLATGTPAAVSIFDQVQQR